MINKKIEFQTITKISKYDVHENLKDEIEIRTDFYDIIKEFLDNVNKYRQFLCMYGKELADLSQYNDSIENLFDQFNDFHFDILNKRRDSNEYMNELKAYDFGETVGQEFSFELKDIVTKDLNDLKREHLGYIYFHIIKEIYKTGVDFDPAFFPKDLTVEFMRNMLISNKVLHVKYIQLKRNDEIIKILN